LGEHDAGGFARSKSALKGQPDVTVQSEKGGAGQAIQNMNLMLGLDERLSLEDPGPWP